MRSWIGMGLVGSILLWSLPSRIEAQGLPVMDVITEAQTTITAIQATITAVESVIHTAHWVLEQTPLDELAMGDEWAADLAQMAALVEEAQALGYSVGSLSSMIQATFSLDSAPENTTDFQLRMREVRQHVSTGYGYALRTQSLILTAQRTITHALRMYEQISDLLGNLGGQQNLSQQLTKLVQIQTESKVTANAYQLAQSMDRLSEPLILQSLDLINEATMSDHPR